MQYSCYQLTGKAFKQCSTNWSWLCCTSAICCPVVAYTENGLSAKKNYRGWVRWSGWSQGQCTLGSLPWMWHKYDVCPNPAFKVLFISKTNAHLILTYQLLGLKKATSSQGLKKVGSSDGITYAKKPCLQMSVQEGLQTNIQETFQEIISQIVTYS